MKNEKEEIGFDAVTVVVAVAGFAVAAISFISAIRNRDVQLNRLASGESNFERHHSKTRKDVDPS